MATFNQSGPKVQNQINTGDQQGIENLQAENILLRTTLEKINTIATNVLADENIPSYAFGDYLDEIRECTDEMLLHLYKEEQQG